MKTTFIMAALLLGFSLSQSNLNAQTTPAPEKSKTGNKGHFIFGTDLVSYTNGMYEEKDYTATVLQNTYKSTFNQVNASLNVWAGFFVSDKVCVGLNYTSNNGYLGSFAYPYYGDYYNILSPFSPVNLFFRLYLTNGDSSHVAIFLEGNAGINYSGGNYTANASNTSSTPEQLNVFNMNGGVHVVFSFNASQHFSVLAKLGVLLDYESYNQPTFTSVFVTQPEESSTFIAPSFVATLGLQYKL